MVIFIIPAFFLFLAGWLLYGVYLAPSQKQQSKVVRKFFVPAHSNEELAIYWAGMSGMSAGETVYIPTKHYLVITVSGEEYYLWVNKSVWDNALLGDSVNLEVSFLFGFLSYVRKFQMADITLPQNSS
jgi:hypothetical protein